MMINAKHSKPPGFPSRLLKKYSAQDPHQTLVHEFEEQFVAMVKANGTLKARLWYHLQVMNVLRGRMFNTWYWNITMLGNYIKTTIRNVQRNKAHTLINTLGLLVGTAVFILISLYVHFELSYDRYHVHLNRIHRIYQTIPYNNALIASTSAPLAEALRQEFPEIDHTVRIATLGNASVTSDAQGFFEDGLIMADKHIFDVFTFPLLQGNPSTVLDAPLSLVISRSMATKYFGTNSPLGRTLTINTFNHDVEFLVTGVFEDIPPNSHFTADFIAPFEAQEEYIGRALRWGNNAYYTYLLLHHDADIEAMKVRLPSIDFTKYSGGYDLHHYDIQPIKDIHLKSDLSNEIAPTGDRTSVALFSFIAILILIIACINAMNLATARADTRVREVGLRKVIGAQRKQLAWQFLSESTLITLCSFVIALILVHATLPAFRNLVERPIVFQPIQNLPLCLTLFVVVLITAALSGIHPALMLSSFKPVSLFGKTSYKRNKSIKIRNGLVVFQFTISTILILSTLIARNQLQLIRNRDMGYDRSHIVVIPIQDETLVNNLQSLKTELKRHPDILDACISSSMPDRVPFRMDAVVPTRSDGESYSLYTIDTDGGFIDVYGMEIVKGRNFSTEYPTDQQGAFLINESAATELESDEPVGQQLALIGRRRGVIVGIVKDFHIQSMSQPIEPLAIYLKPESQRWYWRHLSVKIRSRNIPGTLNFIDETVHRFSPHCPFEYTFYDDIFNQSFKNEQKMGALFQIFAGLAVLIACLGLFGLSSFSAQRRVKEIGIRKVLGATGVGIVVLFVKGFLRWVLVANFIAWPVAYILMRAWLQKFVYRADLSLFIFLLSAGIAILIAAITVSYQSIKAAVANPIDSLRYE